MMQNLAKKAIGAVLGLVIMLGWWTIRGSNDSTERASSIPAKVWAGGAGSLTIEVETTGAAQMRVSFHERDQDEGKSMETHQDISAGTHSWTIDVPPRVGGYIELGAVNPKVGDKLAWRILVNGKVIDEQSETLREALKPNYAFFLQSYFEDYSTGTFGDD